MIIFLAYDALITRRFYGDTLNNKDEISVNNGK